MASKMVKSHQNRWEPRFEDYQQVFSEQNPWHQSDSVPGIFAPPVQRPLAQFLWETVKSNKPRRHHLILGPRRVGKSTVMYQTVQNLIKSGVKTNHLWWLRLDHPLLMQIPLGDLVRFVVKVSSASVTQPAYLFLDELTYAKDWDLWLKTFYDDRWPVRIVGTSSATAIMKERQPERGVGRWQEHFLAPYLLGEYLKLMNINLPAFSVTADLGDTIQRGISLEMSLEKISQLRKTILLTGGFPELLLSYTEPYHEQDPTASILQSQRTLRTDAVERAIYKDIPQAFGVSDPLLLERLLYTLAGQTSQILSIQNLCKVMSGLSQPTCDKYLSYLIQAFLIFLLPNYSGSEASLQKRGRKLFFVDGAVRNAALQRGAAPLNNPEEMGLLLENLVASHLYVLCQQNQVRLHHWRQGTAEVDFIYAHPTAPLAFEIASSPGHSRGGLVKLIESNPRFKGRSYLISPTSFSIDASTQPSGIGMMPLDKFLILVSLQAESELMRSIGR